MKILVFTEGTIIMHKSAIAHSREEIVKQVERNEKSVHDFSAYIPIGNTVKKLEKWKAQGAEILYLTSITEQAEVGEIRKVLKRHRFPKGILLSRKKGEKYKDVVEKIMPDVLVEDDCESIGGEDEMCITHVKAGIKSRIKSIAVKEFGGIDQLPDRISELLKY